MLILSNFETSDGVIVAISTAKGRYSLCRRLYRIVPIAILTSLSISQPALANNAGENYAWQFQTTVDKVNRAYLEDLRLKKQAGYYAAPVYNTIIDRQYNCSVSSLATGNDSVSNAVGNSPTASGHRVTSTGNADTTDLQQGSSSANSSVSTIQGNDGKIQAGASGEIETFVRGDTYQALNTDQVNSGDQSASVSGSDACHFGIAN